MAANVITIEDLDAFKKDLLREIERIISQRQPSAVKKWLKSNEVRRMLLVSPGTLQNLRINGTLPFTKIGTIIFYEYEDIQKMLEKNKQQQHIPVKRVQP